MRRGFDVALVVLGLALGCGGNSEGSEASTETETDTAVPSASTPGPVSPFDVPHDGTLSLGPVDFAESVYANGCGAYPEPLPGLYGSYLAGVQTQHIDGGKRCDACIRILSANGNSVVARVITYGDTGPNDIDVSPDVTEHLAISDEAARAVSWQFVSCPTTAPLYFQFHPESHEWFFRVWFRNTVQPIANVAVKVPGGGYSELEAQLDGGWNAQAGDDGSFLGGFSLRVTDREGKQFEQSFEGVPALYAGPPVVATSAFQ